MRRALRRHRRRALLGAAGLRRATRRGGSGVGRRRGDLVFRAGHRLLGARIPDGARHGRDARPGADLLDGRSHLRAEDDLAPTHRLGDDEAGAAPAGAGRARDRRQPHRDRHPKLARAAERPADDRQRGRARARRAALRSARRGRARPALSDHLLLPRRRGGDDAEQAHRDARRPRRLQRAPARALQELTCRTVASGRGASRERATRGGRAPHLPGPHRWAC